ncbi:hypothetical protein XELAEV_18009790mg [Xenopus laevis]|uniref:Uncharacterized protein n=1 Tax=Xenopus laevis TaxID=8355 RepID=A0A974I0R4_XENLA|nr:hypothetical protein XELAEV_18009790mg [Xenopus laevis]
MNNAMPEKPQEVICKKLHERGYPKNVLQQGKKRADIKRVTRTDRRETKRGSRRIPFEYNSSSNSIGKVLCRLWHIFQRAYPQVGEFTAPPVMSYHRGKTIGSMVTLSNIKTNQRQTDTFLGLRTPGMYPCIGCTQCSNVIKDREFVHPGTGYRVPLQGHFTSQINLGNYRLPVSKHFIDMGHSADQLKYIVLEEIPPLRYGGNRELMLKQREVW